MVSIKSCGGLGFWGSSRSQGLRLCWSGCSEFWGSCSGPQSPSRETFSARETLRGWSLALGFQGPNYWVLKGSRALSIRSLEASGNSETHEEAHEEAVWKPKLPIIL